MNVAVLAGGMGRRFGGVEKSQIRVCGVRIIDMLMKRFSQFNTVIVCRNDEQKSLFSGYKCIVDEYRGYGPLAGIHAALRYFEDYVVVVATDMPFVRVEVLRELYIQAIRNDADVVMPYWKHGKFEPLLSVYSPRITDIVEESLAEGERKILTPVFEAENVVLYDVECLRKLDKELISFFNINTPEDLKRAEEICLSTGLTGK